MLGGYLCYISRVSDTLFCLTGTHVYIDINQCTHACNPIKKSFKKNLSQKKKPEVKEIKKYKLLVYFTFSSKPKRGGKNL